MNFFQKTLAKLFKLTPKKLAKRRYAAASQSNSLSGWNPYTTSPDANIWSGLRLIRVRARDLYDNDPWIKAMLKGITTNVVKTGIRFQSKVKMRRKDDYDIPLNQRIQSAWEAWAENPEWCHTAGKLDIYEMQRIITSSEFIAGEILIRFVYQSFGGSPIPLALELIEADQLDDRYTVRESQETGNQIRMGVELDNWLRPQAYWILPNHPGDIYFSSTKTQPQRITAQDIIYFMCPEGMRPGQTRAISPLHAVMMRSHNLGGYEEAEIVKSRMQSNVSAFIESEFEDADQEDEDGNPVEYFEPGLIRKLLPGEKFSGFNPTSPNPNLIDFVKHFLRAISAGMDVSYYTTTGDYESTNFSSVRAALINERDNFRITQDRLIRKFLRPLYYKWLDIAYLSGVLSLPGYELDPSFYRQDAWYGAGWQWVDPLKDLQASQLALQTGLTTVTKELANLGYDLEDVLAEKQREMKLYDKFGIPYTFGEIPQQQPPIQEEDPPADKKPKKGGF